MKIGFYQRLLMDQCLKVNNTAGFSRQQTQSFKTAKAAKTTPAVNSDLSCVGLDKSEREIHV